jgi:hypothetical protein
MGPGPLNCCAELCRHDAQFWHHGVCGSGSGCLRGGLSVLAPTSIGRPVGGFGGCACRRQMRFAVMLWPPPSVHDVQVFRAMQCLTYGQAR